MVDLGPLAYHATLWNVPESLLLGFHGLAAAPALNEVVVGKTVAVTFSIADNQGLGSLAIIAPGYPISQRVACNAPDIPDTANGTTGSSGQLSYKPESERYTYAWRTDLTWAGTCRSLNIRLRDGTNRVLYFSFR
jgi:hypothetical protein